MPVWRAAGVADDALTLADFQPLIGSDFMLHTGGAVPATARLLDARASHHPLPTRPLSAPAFSLLFEAAPEPLLPQRTYRLDHAQLGSLELFLVPVARTATGLQYEAVFG